MPVTVHSSVSYRLGPDEDNLDLDGDDNIDGRGNSHDNVIIGNTGINNLFGYEGNDTLNGAGGADQMYGGIGDDTYYVNDVGDVVHEGINQGNDLVYSTVSYSLSGQHIENLTLTGGANIDATGNSLNNVLKGNSGDNVLTGGIGDDSLNGGAGADDMYGGLGNDTFYVDNIGDRVHDAVNEGVDRVYASVTYGLAGQNIEQLFLTGSANINATGNSLGNILVGNSGNNVLDGGGGADDMWGGPGNDTYYVGIAGDIAHEAAGEGTDLVISVASYSLAGQHVENLTLAGGANINATGNSLVNVLTGNGGNNVIDGGLGADDMWGYGGDDTYYVDNAGDAVHEEAGQGIDLVIASASFSLAAWDNVEDISLTGDMYARINATGNALDNQLIGNFGANVLDGGLGADIMIGGRGADTYYVDNAGDVVDETTDPGIYTDTVIATINYALGQGVENLVLTGTGNLSGYGNNLRNVLTGNSGNNYLSAGSNDDILDGGLGNDTLVGGDGNDSYYLDNANDVIVETGGGGAGANDYVFAPFTASLLNYANTEHLTLTGMDNIDGTGTSLNNRLTGNSGNNTLMGLGGNDVLDGGGGVDDLWGGSGNDTYIVRESDSPNIHELVGEGRDQVQAWISFSLEGVDNVEDLDLEGPNAIVGTGNSLSNHIMGSETANIIDGGLGADFMTGELGNDTYYLDNVGDSIGEAAAGGVDLVYSSVSYTLQNFVENLTLTGNADINATGNDYIRNILIGNSGNNILDGRGDGDILTGGGGADVFLFQTNSGDDTITDFSKSEGDTININAYSGGVIDWGGVTITQTDSQTVTIDLGGGNNIIVQNAIATDVTSQIVW